MGKKEKANQYELIGSRIEVTSAAHPPYVGLKGKVVDETKNTFLIQLGEKKIVRIPKRNVKFRFKTQAQTLELNGNSLIHRPEDRLKKVIK